MGSIEILIAESSVPQNRLDTYASHLDHKQLRKCKRSYFFNMRYILPTNVDNRVPQINSVVLHQMICL